MFVFFILLQAAEVIPNPWYLNPAIIGPSIGLIAGLLMFYLNKWWEKKRNEDKDEKDESAQQTSLIGQLSQLSKEERQELREAMNKLHARETEFFQRQLDEKDKQLLNKDAIIKSERIAELESRSRAHKLATEVMRLQNHILVLQSSVAKCGGEIPAFTFTAYTEMMLIRLSHNEQLLLEASKDEIHKSETPEAQ